MATAIRRPRRQRRRWRGPPSPSGPSGRRAPKRRPRKRTLQPRRKPRRRLPLLPMGNPLQPRGAVLLVAGAFAAFCLMAVGPQIRFGVPLGALAILIATFGALDVAGTFDDPDDRVAGSVTLAGLARPLGMFLGGALGLWALICLAVDGRLSSSFPVITAGVLVPASFLVTVVGAYRVGEAFGVWSSAERPLLRRHGFWLIALATLLYLPLLGSHSLSDPWETHYGEVVPRDPRPQRLDLHLVGAGRLVLVQAGARLLDPGAGDGHLRRPLRVRTRALGRRRGAHPLAGVGGAHARLPAHADRGVPALQGGGEGLRPARGAARRRGAADHAPVVPAHPPDHDRHALRRAHGVGDGALPPRRRARTRTRRCASTSSPSGP